ncbi:MAG: GSCFA domain-containing protein, partial [Ginsengibacter sp.]
YVEDKQYQPEDLFYLHELWHSWQHHSLFSGIDKNKVLNNINRSQTNAHTFFKQANWLIVTLGSAYHYKLITEQVDVANCHKASADDFIKELVTTEQTVYALSEAIERIHAFNPSLHIVFTVSPVRHIRDGVIENNLSKAVLLQAVHLLSEKFKHVSYFPSYELVIDVLRDYRFFETDMVHPSVMAVDYVFQKFSECYIAKKEQPIVKEIEKIIAAKNHRPFHAGTDAHIIFKYTHLQKAKELQASHPHINLDEEINYFSMQ